LARNDLAWAFYLLFCESQETLANSGRQIREKEKKNHLKETDFA